MCDREKTNLTRAENGRLENTVGEQPGWGVRNRITEACEVQTEHLRFGGVGRNGELSKDLCGGVLWSESVEKTFPLREESPRCHVEVEVR